MADRIGQQVGNYRLVRLLGRGGFAEVYLGEHIDLETMVAIKLLHTRVAEEDLAQFRQEARLLASLRHPQIVRVLDFGVDNETPYVVMDYAQGGTLRTRHARGTSLPASTVVGYVKQIAQALQYAHDHKIVHRDVKPENMLVGQRGEILLSDFGIALIAQSSHYQSTKDIAGTISYMAPEQISAHPRPASDQYSLGIVVYEWLSGRVPFHGSYAEIAIKHTATPPPAPREHLPSLSPDVEYVVLTALAKQPEERFASVSAFARALELASRDMLPTAPSRPRSALSPFSPLTGLPQAGAISARPDPFVPMRTVHIPPDLPNSPVKKTDQPTVSRRVVLIGAASLAGIAAVGTGVLVITHQQSPPSSLLPQTVTPIANLLNQPGSISYIGTAQNVSSSSITVSLPNGDNLTMGINAQTTGDFGTGKSLPQDGQQVKVKAVTGNDGNFAAASLDMVKPEDANNPTMVNTVDFVGVTTSMVGTDNVMHFRIGSKDYSYTVTPTTQVKDFANVQAIPANTSIIVSIQFSGSNGTVLKIGNGIV